MKRKPYIIIIAATALLVGCQQKGNRDAAKATDHLIVTVQGIKSNDWGTKTGAAAAMPYAAPSDTLWLNDSIYVEAVVDDIVAEQTPQTRAVPVTNVSQITALSIVMFNTKTTRWSTSSTQEGEGKSPMRASLVGGGYSIAPTYLWFEEDMNYRTVIAMSPYHNSSGFALSTGGQTLTVTVSSDVTKQYDLCVSDITKNKDMQNIVGSNVNLLKLEMSHVMTAVGFESAGYDLKLTSVELIDINSMATLTLHNHTWSTATTPITIAAKITADQWLNSEHIQSTNPWRNITSNDGYMMLIPQSHTDDMKLEFTFEGRNGQPGGTYTMPLNQIKASGAATSEWKPGMKITYRLRLKTRPAVRNDKVTIADYKAGSASAALNIVTSTDDDLTFSWTASWLGVYRGTSTTVSNPESNGYFTPFTTGVNDFTNVKFFVRNNNNSTIVDRTATVTVTGKKSGVRTFTVTHAKKVLPAALPGSYIPTSALRAAGWPTDRLPAQGLQVAVRGNAYPGNPPSKYDMALTWGATDIDGVFKRGLGEGKNNTDVVIAAGIEDYPAVKSCLDIGPEWYIPSIDELWMIYKNQSYIGPNYSFVNNSQIWSSSAATSRLVSALIFSSSVWPGEPTNPIWYQRSVRCVRDI